ARREPEPPGSRHAPRSGADFRELMAPGGVEPPRAASKAAALSAELRGPQRRVAVAAGAGSARARRERSPRDDTAESRGRRPTSSGSRRAQLRRLRLYPLSYGARPAA